MPLAHVRSETERRGFDRIVYASHSGRLYGTERIAIATLHALRHCGRPLLLAPPGEAHHRCRELGMPSQVVHSGYEWLRCSVGLRRQHRSIAFFATSVTQSLAFFAARPVLQRRRDLHLHVVHGGVDARGSYGRKHLLLPLPVTFVAVSHFVAGELQRHGVPGNRIRVIPNGTDLVGHPRARLGPPRRIVVISRVDRNKRVELLLDALRYTAHSQPWHVDVVGGGSELDRLRARTADQPNIQVHGHRANVRPFLERADLLVHTCPDEPFGLAIAEAMATGLPVLVPDNGGPTEFVLDGVNGFHYRAGCAEHLASRLGQIRATPLEQLRTIARAGCQTARTQLHPSVMAGAYERLATTAPPIRSRSLSLAS